MTDKEKITACEHELAHGTLTAEEAHELCVSVVVCLHCPLRVAMSGKPLSGKDREWAMGVVARMNAEGL